MNSIAGKICMVDHPLLRLQITTHTYLKCLQQRPLIIDIRRDELDTLLLERLGGLFGSVSRDTADFPRFVLQQRLHHGTALHARGA